MALVPGVWAVWVASLEPGSLPWMAYAPDPFTQVLAYRSALLVGALALLSSYLVEPVEEWLGVLHDSVRDDRYLIGMQLQNHPQSKAKMDHRCDASAKNRTEASQEDQRRDDSHHSKPEQEGGGQQL
ncbi:unnamed protein product [Discosporangium mesarthrocarpum]